MTKILVDKAVIEQALEAFELYAKQYPHMVKGYTLDAEEALRNVLQQPQDIAYHEAVSLAKWLFRKHFAHEEDYASGHVVWEPCDTTVGVISQIDNMVCGLVRQQPQVEQEPVAEITCMDEYGPMLGWHKHWVEFPVGTLIYIHPQPPRQPLTHQQREAMWHEAKLLARSTTLPFEWYCRGISDAEAAHGIKEHK